MDTIYLNDEVLASIRRIVRAIDLQSRQLVRRHGLTGPQTLLLRELSQPGEAGTTTVGRLAERMNLSQATVTDILKRLEQRGLVRRARSDTDKRYVEVSLTDAARQLLQAAPPILQETFLERFHALQDWEKLQMIATLHRIADMMDVRDAAPAVPAPAVVTPLDAVSRN